MALLPRLRSSLPFTSSDAIRRAQPDGRNGSKLVAAGFGWKTGIAKLLRSGDPLAMKLEPEDHEYTASVACSLIPERVKGYHAQIRDSRFLHTDGHSTSFILQISRPLFGCYSCNIICRSV